MNEAYIDRIHRYLNGTMPLEERNVFVKEMEDNTTLKNDVELERLLLAGMENAGEKKIRKTIGDVASALRSEGFFEAEEEKETPPSFTIIHTENSFTMKRILSIAATLVVLAGGIWFFLNRNHEVDTNAVFVQNFSPQAEKAKAREVIATMESYGLAGVPSDTDTLSQALELFDSGQYDESLALLKSFSETHPDNYTALYYIGVIHMSQERYAKAIEILLPLSRMEESSLKNDALWNLGLCYLKAENGLNDAREAFTKLADDNQYPNHRGAKAVLDQLLPK